MLPPHPASGRLGLGRRGGRARRRARGCAAAGAVIGDGGGGPKAFGADGGSAALAARSMRTPSSLALSAASGVITSLTPTASTPVAPSTSRAVMTLIRVLHIPRARRSRLWPRTLERLILAHVDEHNERVSADPMEQLELAIAAIFRSWDSPRAKAYRQHHGIPDDLGTAVTVESMAFGNADENSGSGVAFTRNPNDGTKALYGEYLVGRQGEDLVAGTHSPVDLTDPKAMDAGLRASLIVIGDRLEGLYRDAVDMEFTVESGRLYMLQVRPAKRTAVAAVRVAADLVAEGLIDVREAVSRINADQIRKLSRPAFDETALAEARLLVQGLGSSPGHAHGRAMLDSDRAAEAAAKGEPVILMRPTTSPKDIRGMLSAGGVVAATGGALSHAAVVSRALDKPCVVGCESIDIDLARRIFTIGGELFYEGDEISVDGGAGRIYSGAVKLRAVARARPRWTGFSSLRTPNLAVPSGSRRALPRRLSSRSRVRRPGWGWSASPTSSCRKVR
jgi:phosphoenolpyruvate synthase/pyruvate phosphate dikinase